MNSEVKGFVCGCVWRNSRHFRHRLLTTFSRPGASSMSSSFIGSQHSIHLPSLIRRSFRSLNAWRHFTHNTYWPSSAPSTTPHRRHNPPCSLVRICHRRSRPLPISLQCSQSLKSRGTRPTRPRADCWSAAFFCTKSLSQRLHCVTMVSSGSGLGRTGRCGPGRRRRSCCLDTPARASGASDLRSSRRPSMRKSVLICCKNGVCTMMQYIARVWSSSRSRDEVRTPSGEIISTLD